MPASRQLDCLPSAVDADPAARERVYRTMYGALPLGAVVTTLGGIIVWANEPAEELFGGGAGGLVGLALANLYQGDPEQLVRVRKALRAGERFTHEHGLRLADGTQAWIRVHVSTLANAHGEPDHIVLLVENMTARRRLELAVADRENGYRALMQALPATTVMLFDRDRRHYVVEGGDTLSKSGLSRDTVLGRTIDEVASAANSGRLVQIYDAALAGHTSQVEMHRGGCWLDIRTTPVRDAAGNVTGGLLLMHDVTERVSDKRELEERARSIQILETLADKANHFVSSREALRTGLELVCAHADMIAGHVFVPTDDGKRLVSAGVCHGELVGPVGHFLDASRALSLAPGEGFIGRVFDAAAPRWIEDLAEEPTFTRRAAATAAGIRSGGAFPIFMGAEVAAVLEIYASRRATADAKLHDLMATVGAQLGRAFERERFESTLRKRASSDELTGLLNRRGFMASAAERMRVAQDEDRDQVLFFAKIDGRSLVQDRLGPAEGDAVIAAAAAVLRGAFEAGDIVARLGGDELVVFADVEPSAIDATRARILDHLRRMNELPNRRFELALDIATVTVFADGLAELGELLGAGDDAMNEVRRARRAS